MGPFTQLEVYMVTNTSLEQKLNKLRDLSEQAAADFSLEVLGVKIGQQGKYRTFEVCIYDRKEPVGLTQCEKVSRALDTLLEAEEVNDPTIFGGPYLLEVVSPGTDRELKNSYDFAVFAGKSVRVKTREKVGTWGNDFVATLLGGSETQVTLSDLHVYEDKSATKKRASTARHRKETTDRVEDGNLAVAVQNDPEMVIELSNIFKINLYSDDLKKN